MEELVRLLEETARRGASDLHLKVGVAPMMRLDGRLARLPGPMVTAARARMR